MFAGMPLGVVSLCTFRLVWYTEKKPEYKSKKLDSYVDVKLFYILLEKTTLKCDDKSRKQQGFAYTWCG